MFFWKIELYFAFGKFAFIAAVVPATISFGPTVGMRSLHFVVPASRAPVRIQFCMEKLASF